MGVEPYKAQNTIMFLAAHLAINVGRPQCHLDVIVLSTWEKVR